MLCQLGFHQWQSRRITHRPGTSVYLCKRCGERKILHKDRRRFLKRYALLSVVGVSLILWFAIINVARTGHTRVLHTTHMIVHKVDRVGGKARAAIHRVEGDEGNYVDGQPRGRGAP